MAFKIIQPHSRIGQVLDYYAKGIYPGVATGYSNIDEYYKPRIGNTTIITGYPSMGKTEFLLQMLCNTTSLHGWKHALYTPETGTCVEIILELVHKFTGKTYRKNYANSITESELITAINMITDHFYIIEPDDVSGLTVDEWYAAVKEIDNQTRIHTASIDNWNDLVHDLNNFGGKISEYLKFQIPKFNRFCKTEMISGFILAHPKSPDKMNGKILPAKPNDIEGGSLWWAKAQTIITIHRELDEQNAPTEVIFHKVKPKIVGKRGVTELQYHVADNCYSIDGTRNTQPVSILKTKEVQQVDNNFKAPF